MGEVYRAHDAHLGRDVALKTLPEAFATDPERVARFEREARILATLNHPNIATLFGFEKQDGVLALVMELVEGQTLHDHLMRIALPGRGLPLAEVIGIARQIVDALDAAHEKGIVHRDLKPANIKLTPDGAVKVLDFGLAKAIVAAESGGHQTETRTLSPAETRPNAVMGTAAYMSPEQARGLPLDRRTDVWAFGCVLYEMLAGRPAFARATSSDTIAAVLTGEIDWSPLPASLPPAMRQLVVRCLERSTKGRLRDIADARPYLDEAAAPTSSASGAHAIAGVAPQSGVSRRALLTSSAAVGLLGAGLGAAYAGRRSDPVALPSYQRLTFRRGMIRTARFGPDFQTVLYGALWDGDVCRVYTVRPESPESSAVALPPATPLAVSSTGELALALGTHRRGIMTYGTLARVPMAGGAPRELLENVKFADWSPDGTDLAVVRGTGDRDVLEFPAGKVIAEPSERSGGFSFPRVSPRGDAVAVFELEFAGALWGKVAIIDRSGARRAESARFVNVFGLAWHGDDVWFTAADELPLLRNAVHAMDAIRRGAGRRARARQHQPARHRARRPRADCAHRRSRRHLGASPRRHRRTRSVVARRRQPGRSLARRQPGAVLRAGRRRWAEGLGAICAGPTDRRRCGSATARPLALSPDGRWAIAQSDPPHLDLIPTGAGASRRLERAGLSLLSARWLPDGKRVVTRARAGQGARAFVRARGRRHRRHADHPRRVDRGAVRMGAVARRHDGRGVHGDRPPAVRRVGRAGTRGAWRLGILAGRRLDHQRAARLRQSARWRDRLPRQPGNRTARDLGRHPAAGSGGHHEPEPGHAGDHA